MRKGTDSYFSNEKGQSTWPHETGGMPGGLRGLAMKQKVFHLQVNGSKPAEDREWVDGLNEGS